MFSTSYATPSRRSRAVRKARKHTLTRCDRMRRYLYWFVITTAALVGIMDDRVHAQTGTFIDRHMATDLRVVSYNILWDTIFPDNNPVQADKFERVLTALDPDILNLQEIGDPYCWESCTRKRAEDVRVLLNNLAPLVGGGSWYVHQGRDNVIASKYPLSMQRGLGPGRKAAMALVDLPDDRYGTDLYVMNNHFKGGYTMEPPEPFDPYQVQRQGQADALVNFMRDARTIGKKVDLPFGTPMLVVGDLNIYNDPGLVLDPLGTVLSGDIFYEERWGADSPPDWDGSSLTDAHPLHNGRGPDDYTYRYDSGRFDPGILDYILYTDSVIQEANKFVLNTVDMTSTERLATGLQEFDITLDLVGDWYDHLPVVTDFRLVPEPISILLDIKPGGSANPVNLKSKGVLPVAILGTDEFDVNEVNFDTLLFGDPLLIDNGGTAVSPLRSGLEDVSGDGFLDLTLKFSTADLVEFGALGSDTIEGLLTGALLDGTPIEGMDSIRIVPPNRSNGNSLQISTVPEPSSFLLATLAGLYGLGARHHRKRK